MKAPHFPYGLCTGFPSGPSTGALGWAVAGSTGTAASRWMSPSSGMVRFLLHPDRPGRARVAPVNGEELTQPPVHPRPAGLAPQRDSHGQRPEGLAGLICGHTQADVCPALRTSVSDLPVGHHHGPPGPQVANGRVWPSAGGTMTRLICAIVTSCTATTTMMVSHNVNHAAHTSLTADPPPVARTARAPGTPSGTTPAPWSLSATCRGRSAGPPGE